MSVTLFMHSFLHRNFCASRKTLILFVSIFQKKNNEVTDMPYSRFLPH